MEKKTAHYPLPDIQALVQQGAVRATKTALEGAASIGFNFDDMRAIVGNLDQGDFYKSMTSYNDHTVWQDVYHYPAKEGDIYIKLQIVGDVVIVSFKEL